MSNTSQTCDDFPLGAVAAQVNGMNKKILIIEDEIEIARLIQRLLEKEGFSCHHCSDGGQAISDFKSHTPDLVILDWMLPGELDGLEVCTRIRQHPSEQDSYILMLSAKGEDLDRVIGLSTGADDYLVKPFSPIELVARVRALLRRRLQEADSAQIYQTHHFSINLDQHVRCCLKGSIRPGRLAACWVWRWAQWPRQPSATGWPAGLITL